MAVQEHTERGNPAPALLEGDTELARWLSVKKLAEFCVLAPDDSMAPALRKGSRLTFDTRLAPREGDFALFVDSTGRAFVREYRGKKRGGFQAVPTNRDFLDSTFHGKRDGLVSLGVLTFHVYAPRSMQ